MGLTRNFSTYCFLFHVLGIFANDNCDISKCPGPLNYYQDLKCIPVYKLPEDCCPYKYNCDHLDQRSTTKCYINGHEYEIGEHLRDEDKNPCSKGCFCSSRRGIASFTCAIVDCFSRSDPNCYLPRNATQCCPGKQVCVERQEDIVTCEVDGKSYKDGENFSPAAEPHKNCYCGPGYTGENIAPFCVTLVDTCRTELNHAHEVHNNCAPVYYKPESLNDGCPIEYRCQNKRDQVIKKNPASESNSDVTCKFGDLTMNYGDELNQATGYNSVCVKCTCEVGPIPSCYRLPASECDITNHPPFDNNK
ncbi:uncharacterized protein LOC130664472 isoform X1 [Microplitis mediator]|uniref:uncharacterized protein LOC130664472 isoform X1 n=1 Tax=Microplitis mediator TaxID=375433 RepID=UPI0025541F93|nr:uncharacterized protein LOC130664472 isoform X1 [Microplitis mediator]